MESDVEKRRFGIRLGAPFFFFLTALFRCYLETHVFAARPYFSWFVALHHLFWFFTTILAFILIAHLILKVAVEKLLWLMYGAVLLMLPIIVVVIQGKSPGMDYLTGSFREIILHIVTFYSTCERNLPLRTEITVIVIGMTIVGYLYSRNWRRGLVLGAAIYLIGNLLAINWIGPVPNSKAVVMVHTALLPHPFMAVVYAHTTTFFSALAAGRAGLIRGSCRCRFLAITTAVVAAGVYMAIVALTGWFSSPIDMFLTALPVWTTVSLATIYRCRQHVLLSRWFWIIGLTVLFFQWAALGPLYFHIGVVKPLTTQEFWMLPHRS
jgi:hypothetical protein